MRSSSDVAAVRLGRVRRRTVLIVAAVVIIVFLLSLRSLAILYTDSLWYSSIGQHEVFSTVLETKVGLFLTFGLVFFIGLWGNLLLCNRLGPSELYLDAPEDELVRRYRAVVRPFAGRLYAGVSIVIALIAASSAVGQWQHYLLFVNAQSFHRKDPLFGMDIGFYVFRLPFLTFLVDWLLASVFAIFVLSAIFHYLNGGIRAARVRPRVSDAAKAHLSVLLAVLALCKAAGYLVARWHMVTATDNGVVQGAGYTDVHARLPALMVLFYLCLAAAAILLWNIRQRSWTLPAIAVGLWAFVALVIGVIYPAILQAVKVTPAQSTLEKPYIERNIAATRAAYGLENVSQPPWATTTNSPLTGAGVTQTLADVRLWDPTSSITLATTQQVQGLASYYSFSQLGEDRYDIDGKLVPVLVGARELNASALPISTWVNQHLVYTHGYGVVMIPSNADPNPSNSGANPVYDVGRQGSTPQTTAPGSGFPTVREPEIYYGLSQNGYVVVDTSQQEFDYPAANVNIYANYKSKLGGVTMGGDFRRLMMAVRFGDPNLFFSSDISSSSRILFVRNVVQIAQRAAPFLSIDAHPYLVVLPNGQVDWILDGYTTTDEYPYSQNAGSQYVPNNNGLPSSYNYVRNSVKIVVNAYTGQVWLFQAPPIQGETPAENADPILQAWSAAFPGLIQPYSSMPAALQAHMRYPEDLFSIQSAIYGRYHQTNELAFYNNGGGWNISPTEGAGSPTSGVSTSTGYSKSGYPVSTNVSRMTPLYELYAPPGQSSIQFTISDAYVSATQNNSASSSSGTVLNLRAFMMGLSNGDLAACADATQSGAYLHCPSYDYGELDAYRPTASTLGPVTADASMQSNETASRSFTYYNSQGSKVLLGNTLMVPIDGSMLYVRPAYIEEAKGTALPKLEDVIVQYKSNVGFAQTLDAAVAQVFSGTAPPPPSKQTAAELVSEAEALVQAANSLQLGTPGALGTYQRDIQQAIADFERAAQLSGTSTTKKSSGSSHH